MKMNGFLQVEPYGVPFPTSLGLLHGVVGRVVGRAAGGRRAMVCQIGPPPSQPDRVAWPTSELGLETWAAEQMRLRFSAARRRFNARFSPVGASPCRIGARKSSQPIPSRARPNRIASSHRRRGVCLLSEGYDRSTHDDPSRTCEKNDPSSHRSVALDAVPILCSLRLSKVVGLPAVKVHSSLSDTGTLSGPLGSFLLVSQGPRSPFATQL